MLIDATENPELTEDLLLGGRVRLRQPAEGYRTAIDPVLLAAATAAQAGERVLDLGCGTGAAALCLVERVPQVTVTGLERYPPAAALAAVNADINGHAARFCVVEGDLLEPPGDVADGRFDRVMANPPYLAAHAASVPPDPWKAAANVEGPARLADWIAAAARLLKPRGTLTLVHRADRIDEILAALQPAFGGVTIFPLWPAANGAAAKRVLIAATNGGRAPARLAAGLVLHDPGGGFTVAARAVLEEARALVL